MHANDLRDVYIVSVEELPLDILYSCVVKQAPMLMFSPVEMETELKSLL